MWTSRIISAALFALSLPAVLGQKKDVIMIAIDDMRPELHCYGCDYIILGESAVARLVHGVSGATTSGQLLPVATATGA
jgi:hypothetical protein